MGVARLVENGGLVRNLFLGPCLRSVISRETAMR